MGFLLSRKSEEEMRKLLAEAGIKGEYEFLSEKDAITLNKVYISQLLRQIDRVKQFNEYNGKPIETDQEKQHILSMLNKELEDFMKSYTAETGETLEDFLNEVKLEQEKQKRLYM